jgi:CubicO group peptidase (beta-lactamase class C family)
VKVDFRSSVAVLALVSIIVVAFACDSPSKRMERFERGLHSQPEMDVGRLFDYGSERLSLIDRMEEHDVPGLAVTVIDDGRVDWSKTWGFRDASSRDPVTSETVFEAGSTTKLTTATLVMMLVEEGTLSLDDPVNDQLKRWAIPENEYTAQRPVTLRMLLAHTSGLNRPEGMFAYEGGSVPYLLDVLNGEAPAVNDPVTVEAIPGERHGYSNLAYNVIQLLIEDATGKQFVEVMRERVFEPLAMRSCTYDFPFSAAVLPRVAFPHDGDGRPHMNDLHPSALAHGGLLCTSEDLAKLGVELVRAYRGESRLMKAATFREMLRNQHDPEDAVGGFNGQGLGMFTLSDRNTLYFAHQGYNVPGTCSLLFANPETGDGCVVMANGAGGFGLIFEIIAGLADLYDWPEVEPA